MTIDELSKRLREISREAHSSPQGLAIIGHGQAGDLVRLSDAAKAEYEQAKNMGDASFVRTVDASAGQENTLLPPPATALVQKLVKALEYYREEEWLGGEDGVAAQALTEAEAYLKQQEGKCSEGVDISDKLRNMMLAHLDGIYKFSARENCDELVTQLIELVLSSTQQPAQQGKRAEGEDSEDRKKQGGFVIGDIVEYIGQYKNDDGWKGYTFIICEIRQKRLNIEYTIREHDRHDGLVDGLLESDLRLATTSQQEGGAK